VTVHAITVFRVGARYVNRAGAVLRLIQIWPDKRYAFLVLVVERMANGETPELEYKVTVGPDGYYSSIERPHDLDLVSEVAVLGSAA
jgi:hypothetical protein